MANDPDSRATAAPTDSSPADEAALHQHAAALADGVQAALSQWVVRSVARLTEAWAGSVPDTVVDEAAAAGRQAAEEVGPLVRVLLDTDVDEQWTSPMSIVRQAVKYPTGVLQRAGVPHVVRDEFTERSFPDDVYALVPATFGELDPSLHELGLSWGAAKAFVVLARRRAEGRR
jgi:hypothetical protein